MEVICGETTDDAIVAGGVARHRNSVTDLSPGQWSGWMEKSAALVAKELISRGREERLGCGISAVRLVLVL
jgi:hypothetical protein